MVRIIMFSFLAFIAVKSFAAKDLCSCKCVVKNEDGKYSFETGTGKDRESAGNNLKKSLKKRKCELSPDCTGKCWPKE